ncbi:sulfotransferase [Parvularcula sp. LCG005]|uniref:sulfotransferase n=1 Tax=Parvularcula sp. LCG005 TaxID=3078805 RepID=UPI002943ADA1|nr:sulfotransferase [Parvularcula sp. LCG005]WOI54460.1 sulfotransferase [Parvularcula sp. LCG005]
MTEHPPLLHVGYIKTGSTFLQNQIFADRGYGFMEACPASRSRLASELILSNPYLFDPVTARNRLLQDCAIPAGKVPVWSEEVLLGDPLVRRYDGKRNAERLHAIFPDARVLIVFREQRAMIVSAYKEYINQGNAHSLTDFIGTGEEPAGFSPILDPSFLQYSHAIRHYQLLFGAENVLALPFELFKKDGDGFVARICRFAGLPATDLPPVSREVVNKRRGARTLEMERFLNRFAVNSPLKPGWSPVARGLRRAASVADKLIPGGAHAAREKSIRTQIAARFGDFYSADNAKVSALIGEDLSALGYQ